MLTTKTGAGLVSGVAPEPNEGPTMLISIIKGFVVDGRDVKAGEKVEVPEKFARQMIDLGRAELAEDKPRKKGRSKKDE